VVMRVGLKAVWNWHHRG